MLHNLKDLEGYTISATDGDIGRVKDFYFDDHAWVIRHIVVETGDWLASRKVLVSPQAIQYPDWSGNRLPVAITKGQIRHSPKIDTDKPISRQHESQHLSYYGYPHYWDGDDFRDIKLPPALLPPATSISKAASKARQSTEVITMRAQQTLRRDDDPHLRSCKLVTGYNILATDGEIGHIDGFLVDEVDWSIRYLIVNTSNWWLGHQVLIAPQWFKDVNWVKQTVSLSLDRQSVMDAPVFSTTEALDRQFESALYAHYQRDAYWPEDALRAGHMV
ncbi:PRC-barrel domain-containing protein [Uliginosibacterium aquaticum]|uniref:PRC-barrel domain-containing protein n=1 Tax=Uliginosibacterium aquaticum TaxID=2731212 RepID=A0ABX2IM09_9RHOO|nr:PRC-barrel domain-containing protein [Uliginosibacterium aquaticum]NSL55075.1 PRC-barrel domain-containing protein [Uliginosibacterium aquaticum]